MEKIFGTDGVRGTANTEPLTVETLVKIGLAAGHVFKQGTGHARIVLGKDTRLSGYMVEGALASGICSMGGDVVLLGPLPTPGVAFITASLRASAGIMISASHNMYEENGVKFFSSLGQKLSDATERRLEDLILSEQLTRMCPIASKIGKAFRDNDATGRYVEFIKASFPRRMTLDGLKIVLDCANGAAYSVAPKVFRELGAELIVYGDHPDGTNINDHCGSTHPDVIFKAVKQHGADVGIALDGDADRVILCDHEGNVVDGDQILAICAIDLAKEGKLRKNTAVGTTMSNMGLEMALKKAGVKLLRTDVGDQHVMTEMIKSDLNLGGEQSGHVIFRDFTTTGDGLISALQVLRIMRKYKQPLAQLARCMKRFPQVLVNVRVREKIPFQNMSEIRKASQHVVENVGKSGRLLLRYSGTENVARVMVEGPDHETITRLAKSLARRIKEKIGDC